MGNEIMTIREVVARNAAAEKAMAEDAAYRLCRRASASALCLPKEAAR